MKKLSEQLTQLKSRHRELSREVRILRFCLSELTLKILSPQLFDLTCTQSNERTSKTERYDVVGIILRMKMLKHMRLLKILRSNWQLWHSRYSLHFSTRIPSSANLQSALWFISDNDIMFIYPSSTPGTTHQNGIW